MHVYTLKELQLCEWLDFSHNVPSKVKFFIRIDDTCLSVCSVFPGDFLLQTYCRSFAPGLLSPRPSPKS